MLKDYSKPSISVGNLTGVDKNKSIERVKTYIISHVSDFITEVKKEKIYNEVGLNSKFVIVMNNFNSSEMFYFHHENPEDHTSGQSARIDIGVYARGCMESAFFAFEAKRLDSKKVNKGKRKKEYVVNDNGGGIERFKNNTHGVGLSFAGMIGYIQTDDYDIWQERINQYIDEEIDSSSIKEVEWNEDDKLLNDKKLKDYATYNSKHIRKDKTEINLFHLWINLII